jgi:hypothetical protein
MDSILLNAQKNLQKAAADAEYWRRFIHDYTALSASRSSPSKGTQTASLPPSVLGATHGRNSIPSEYSTLKMAGMGKCLEMTKDLIVKHGAIASTRKVLEHFAEAGYTAKPHSLAAYLSQSKDFIFDKEKGGWVLKQHALIS